MIKQSYIYIVIVTYNGMQWLPKCLESTMPYHVIIVDNNSTDGTVSFIEESYPNIILIKQQGNLGFGQANNLGISEALKNGAEYVFLLNQDAYLVPNTIANLIEEQKLNKEYGILSPVHLNGDGTQLDKNFSNYVNYNANKNFYSDYVLPNREVSNLYEIPFVNAAGWLISKKCLEVVGGFDPIFFHYGEDDNYCQRLRYHNLKIGIVPKNYLMHDRENRKESVIKYGSDAYFSKIARSFKIRYADINRNSIDDLERSFMNRKKSRLKSYLKLNFKTANFYTREIKMLKSIIPEIKESRATNLKKRANYLNV